MINKSHNVKNIYITFEWYEVDQNMEIIKKLVLITYRSILSFIIVFPSGMVFEFYEKGPVHMILILNQKICST